jgi:hypothetical protein
MGLADEIRAAIAQMPLQDQKIINATYTALRYTCALADELGKPDKLYGASAVALLGAEYQDLEDAAP